MKNLKKITDFKFLNKIKVNVLFTRKKNKRSWIFKPPPIKKILATPLSCILYWFVKIIIFKYIYGRAERRKIFHEKLKKNFYLKISLWSLKTRGEFELEKAPLWLISTSRCGFLGGYGSYDGRGSYDRSKFQSVVWTAHFLGCTP